MGGKTYYEGQRFEAPGAKDLNCICQKNFVGKFEEPFCRPVSCGIELLDSDSFRGNCAPIYYGKDRVCPIQWQCSKFFFNLKKSIYKRINSELKKIISDENVKSIQLTKQNKGIGTNYILN